MNNEFCFFDTTDRERVQMLQLYFNTQIQLEKEIIAKRQRSYFGNLIHSIKNILGLAYYEVVCRYFYKSEYARYKLASDLISSVNQKTLEKYLELREERM